MMCISKICAIQHKVNYSSIKLEEKNFLNNKIKPKSLTDNNLSHLRILPLVSKAMLECFQTFLLKRLLSTTSIERWEKMRKGKSGPTESLTHSKSCWKSSDVLIVGNLRCIFFPQEFYHLLNQLTGLTWTKCIYTVCPTLCWRLYVFISWLWAGNLCLACTVTPEFTNDNWEWRSSSDFPKVIKTTASRTCIWTWATRPQRVCSPAFSTTTTLQK